MTNDVMGLLVLLDEGAYLTLKEWDAPSDGLPTSKGITPISEVPGADGDIDALVSPLDKSQMVGNFIYPTRTINIAHPTVSIFKMGQDKEYFLARDLKLVGTTFSVELGVYAIYDKAKAETLYRHSLSSPPTGRQVHILEADPVPVFTSINVAEDASPRWSTNSTRGFGRGAQNGP